MGVVRGCTAGGRPLECLLAASEQPQRRGVVARLATRPRAGEQRREAAAPVSGFEAVAPETLGQRRAGPGSTLGTVDVGEQRPRARRMVAGPSTGGAGAALQ